MLDSYIGAHIVPAIAATPGPLLRDLLAVSQASSTATSIQSSWKYLSDAATSTMLLRAWVNDLKQRHDAVVAMCYTLPQTDSTRKELSMELVSHAVNAIQPIAKLTVRDKTTEEFAHVRINAVRQERLILDNINTYLWCISVKSAAFRTQKFIV